MKGYAIPKDGKFSEKEKRNIYLEEAIKCSNITDLSREQIGSYFLSEYRKTSDQKDEDVAVKVLASKKYKPVALKMKPVYAELPDNFRIK